MAMSKSCYNGCYNRRSCYNHGCCNQQSSGVSTGSLLAAGVAASLLVLALDCDDTTATTTTCTATAVGLTDPFGYVLPGVASDDRTALQRTSARQPLGLFGAPAAATDALTTTSIITYGFTTTATATTVFSATANTVGVPNTPVTSAFTTRADLVNAFQVYVKLEELFAAISADVKYTLTAANVTTFFNTAGFNTADPVFCAYANIEGLQRFVSGVGATATAAAPFATAGATFPSLSGALTVGDAANAITATYGSTGFNGVQNVYGSTSIDANAAASIGTVSLFQTSTRYTSSVISYDGITTPAQNDYAPVPTEKTGFGTTYSLQFTAGDIAAAAGTATYAVKFLAWRSTYTSSPVSETAGLESTPTSALTFLTNVPGGTDATQSVDFPASNLVVPGVQANIAVLLQYAFSYIFKPPTAGFFVGSGNLINSVYAYSGGATTKGQSGGAIANTDTQQSLVTGDDLQCLAIVQLPSGPP